MIDALQNVLSGANNELAKGVNLTETPQGNPTDAFAPKKIEVPQLPSYSMARHARRGGIVLGT